MTPSSSTAEFDMKFVPLTVSVTAAPELGSAFVLPGDNEETPGTGSDAPPPPPPPPPCPPPPPPAQPGKVSAAQATNAVVNVADRSLREAWKVFIPPPCASQDIEGA